MPPLIATGSLRRITLTLISLPTDEEWIFAAGHMPKDVAMNSGHVEKGLTAVDAYS